MNVSIAEIWIIAALTTTFMRMRNAAFWHREMIVIAFFSASLTVCAFIDYSLHWWLQ